MRFSFSSSPQRIPGWAPPLALLLALVAGLLLFFWSLGFIRSQLEIATNIPQGAAEDGAPTFDQAGFLQIAPRLGLPAEPVGGEPAPSATPSPEETVGGAD